MSDLFTGQKGDKLIIAVIPCHNEEKYIKQIVLQAREYVDRVLVSDDGSTDKTVEVAGGVPMVQVVKSINGRRGVGSATRHGIKWARMMQGDIIITLNGDGQHKPDEIRDILQPILNDEADFVIGARIRNGSMPAYRLFGNRVITWLYNIGSKNKIFDAQSCYRAYNEKSLNLATITEDGFAFSVETLVKARHNNLRIKEVPINCIYHKDFKLNSSMNPIKHGISVAWALIKWRLRLEIIPLLRFR